MTTSTYTRSILKTNERPDDEGIRCVPFSKLSSQTSLILKRDGVVENKRSDWNSKERKLLNEGELLSELKLTVSLKAFGVSVQVSTKPPSLQFETNRIKGIDQ